MPKGVPKAPLIDRFMRRVNKDGPVVNKDLGPCWLWGGGVVDGYGQLLPHIWGEGLAHRWSYLFHHGELDASVIIRHKCDVRLCVNPAHLEAGGAIDNVHDMLLRNPLACNRKITIEQIAEIKALRATGMIYREIAERYSVNRRTIERICLDTLATQRVIADDS